MPSPTISVAMAMNTRTLAPAESAAPDTLPQRRQRTGGIAGNERLTHAVAAALTVLLAAEGITILRMQGLRSVHMFLGLVLIGPLALKVGSTGYRFARYYAGAPTYRRKGPPLLLLRALAPVLVLSTLGIFVTGVGLLVAGHTSDTLLMLHKASFIVWSAMFAVHFLAYAPRVGRSLRDAATATRREPVSGVGLRATVLAAALGGGLALALALVPAIGAYRTHP